MCLDWREVCNSVVDCLDGGVDEENCFLLEINECEDDEYRCHNGLCIPEGLWEDDHSHADCLDRSDEPFDDALIQSCLQDPTFECEEHSCRPSSANFPCGDGQCVPKLAQCDNGRHLLLMESVSSQGSLSEHCWSSMVCLNKLLNEVNGVPCADWMGNNTVAELLSDCNSFYSFPVLPIHFGHVRLFYNHSYRVSSNSGFLLPDYICYDEQLCPFYPASLVFDGNLTCSRWENFSVEHFFVEYNFENLFLLVQYLFETCSITRADLDVEKTYRHHPSLYQCQGSLKLISKHRLADGNADCDHGDDENSSISCSLNHRHRRRCLHDTQCLSPILQLDSCPNAKKSYPSDIPFREICNDIDEVHYSDPIDERSIDEADCEPWPCDNIYTRCDGFWTCPNGRDEDGCYPALCPPRTYACISPVNFTLLCLSKAQMRDDTIDCLGAADKLLYCRITHPSEASSHRFNCLDQGPCLKSSELCDKVIQCLENEDDERFCSQHRLICDEKLNPNRSVIEMLLCGLGEQEAKATRFFSLQTSPTYPQVQIHSIDGTSNEFTNRLLPRREDEQVNLKDNPGPWLCNRGLTSRAVVVDSSQSCFCPPSYYGDRCEYQNQRVSLTLQITSSDRRATFAIVSMLIDESDEQQQQQIVAVDQFVYIVKESCSVKINRYLLFPTRPKNLLTNYSVRIDAIDKNSMGYVGSWHLSIPFLFLPVNRLVAVWTLNIQSIPISSRCSRRCEHGVCTRYLNKEISFCRCSSGWSGHRCDRSIVHQPCSPTSLTLGVTNNRSICVCSLDKFGPQCLFHGACPLNACDNGGQCVPADLSRPDESYTCVCPERFFGDRCEHFEAKVFVTLVNLDIPKYLVAYFFTLSKESNPSDVIMLQKLTLFQRMVTFRIRVSFHLVVVKVEEDFYLAVLQQSPRTSISTSISPQQRCAAIDDLFDADILQMPRFRRVKHYHRPCQTDPHLQCFTDEGYFCLCTKERHANCVHLDRQRDFQCAANVGGCVNGGRCLQDHPRCPSERICVCTDCFFGDRCQFYAKGLGSTLDEILGYEIRRSTPFVDQPFTVQVSALITMVLFLVGTINGFLSILTFVRPKSQELGCGVYLFASSINSIIAMVLFALKYWLLFLSHQPSFAEQIILYANCLAIEPLLKIVIYVDNWLNAFVAIERAMSVFQGISFDKKKSKEWAKWIIAGLCLVVVGLFVPQILHLRVFVDEKEERTWCVVSYRPWLYIYSSSLIFFHYFAPLLINLFSAVFIIFATARQRTTTQNDRPFHVHLKSKVNKYKHLLLSPLIIVVLTLPHLIISIILDCNKSSYLFWFYLAGYFLSFFPAMFIFVIFVVPSAFYKREFREAISKFVRRLRVFQLKHRSL